MENKNILRLFTTILIIVMIFTTMNGIAFATEKSITEKGNAQTYAEILGFKTKNVSYATEKKESFKIMTENEVQSSVEAYVLENGDIFYNVVEETASDYIVIKPDGRIFIDGSLITIQEDNEKETPLLVDYIAFKPGVQPCAQRNEFTSVCPYGSPSDYTNSTTARRVLDLGKETFDSITSFAWGSIVATGLSIGGVSLVPAIIITFGLDKILDFMKARSPFANACSLKDVRSVHKEKGFSVTSSMSVAKHSTTFYANKDYTSPIKDDNDDTVRVAYEVYTY